MDKYNSKIEVDPSKGFDDEDLQDLLDYLDKWGPYIYDEWNEYHNGVHICYCFSDPDFIIGSLKNDPYTLEGELYKYGNQHYLAIAHTIKTLREFYATDDEIFDWFVEQGKEWFGDAEAGALMETCCRHICTKWFEMPTSEDFDD